MSIQFTLPWIMSALTIWTMVMAGEKRPMTWLVGLVNQALWLIWILHTEAWGLLPMNVALWVVYARNHLIWTEVWQHSRLRCKLRGYHVNDASGIGKFRYDCNGWCHDCGKVGDGVLESE